MKKISVLLAVLIFSLALAASTADARKTQTPAKNGNKNNCPVCGQAVQGHPVGTVNVPNKLARPKNRQWLDKLKSALLTEKLSLSQYQADGKKYGDPLPYLLATPQEKEHIDWLGKLLAAYGLSSELKKIPFLPSQPTKNIDQAYGLAEKLKADLIPNYEWLIKTAGDRTARALLENLLLQTRLQYTMFNHFRQMESPAGKR